MYVPTGLLFSIAFFVVGFNARVPGYKLAPVFLIPILWIPYLLRRWLHLNPYHYLLLGEERGMLKPHTAYFLDTSRDLMNNFLGCITALVIYRILRALRRPLR